MTLTEYSAVYKHFYSALMGNETAQKPRCDVYVLARGGSADPDGHARPGRGGGRRSGSPQTPEPIHGLDYSFCRKPSGFFVSKAPVVRFCYEIVFCADRDCVCTYISDVGFPPSPWGEGCVSASSLRERCAGICLRY
ncbi:hypothetical protein CCHR01_13623 [Colletotrichum chrysophilum]|uniref:Uncharacterized protein n=1 Tax=Colletotrichum chrysophilum TaxID=1836956 RepID=A0AAD9A955_9PEZI|nr:hypothetical protein CCHR01_13623 [Colletotrichum chrysophilum]